MSECPTLPFDAPASPERWLPVVGYEGFYQVSNLGRVRRTWETRTNGDRRRNPSGILKPIDVHGYPAVNLWAHGQLKRTTIHLLVIAAFVGPRPEGMPHTRHLDGNPQNNSVENLAYGTASENLCDEMRHGTHRYAGDYCSNGHEYTPENTMQRSDGGRRCRTCKRKTGSATQKRRHARRRAEKVAAQQAA